MKKKKSPIFYIGIFVLLSTLASSCQNSGELYLALDVAAAGGADNPFNNNNIQIINVTVTRGEETESYTARYEGPGNLDMGDIDVGGFSRIVVRGNTIDGVLIAYGSVEKTGSLNADNRTKVTIPFRYPLVYLGGGPALKRFHPFRKVVEDGLPAINLGESLDHTSGVAVSPDGQYILVTTFNLSGSNSTVTLFALSTRDHQRLREATFPADEPLDRIVFNPSGNLVALYTPGSTTVKFVNINSYFEKDDNVTAFATKTITTPLEIAWTDDYTAAVLKSQQYTYNTCVAPTSSSLQLFHIPADLRADSTITEETPLSLPKYTSSMSTEPETGRIFLAHPCHTEVSVNPAGESQINTLFDANSLSPCRKPVQLLTGKKYLYTSCHTAEDTQSATWSPAQLIIQRVGIGAAPLPNNPIVVDYYPSEALQFELENDPPGTKLQLMQDAIEVLPLQLGLAVDGDKVVLLSEGYYESEQITINGQATTLLPEMRKSRSVIIIDPNSLSVTRRFRAACYRVTGLLDYSIPQDGLDGDSCGQMDGVDTPPVEFIPKSITAIYGK